MIDPSDLKYILVNGGGRFQQEIRMGKVEDVENPHLTDAMLEK